MPPPDRSVLIVGSGGREHALALALAKAPSGARVAFAGGENAGLEAMAERLDPQQVLERAPEFDLVVIGPEAPLAEGLADDLRHKGVAVFGPGRAAAELETSKAFTKRICEEAGIPTARAAICDDAAAGHAAIDAMDCPVVVKADGLAAGKGVIVTDTAAEAKAAVDRCFSGEFGTAGARVVIEERLFGPELSLFALSDGNTVRSLATARDYKRAFDGDRGPNTGGMGAISPAPDVSDGLCARAMDEIVIPAVETLKARGIPYIGVLYAGLMLTDEGPKLIEFNVRFGDPECQAILPRVDGDIFALLHATATGTLAEAELSLSADWAVAVVVAAGGYPGAVEKGEVIGGLADVERAGAAILHAGTRQVGADVLSNGGRVLAAVGVDGTREGARAKTYTALSSLDWPGGRMRSDIGL